MFDPKHPETPHPLLAMTMFFCVADQNVGCLSRKEDGQCNTDDKQINKKEDAIQNRSHYLPGCLVRVHTARRRRFQLVPVARLDGSSSDILRRRQALQTSQEHHRQFVDEDLPRKWRQLPFECINMFLNLWTAVGLPPRYHMSRYNNVTK
jgi:hypothetical protein